MDGSYRGMAEGELEVTVPVLPVPVTALACRVGRTGHDAAVGEEVLHGGKTFDAIDLEVEREGDELSDTGDPEQALDIGRGNELGLELLLDA